MASVLIAGKWLEVSAFQMRFSKKKKREQIHANFQKKKMQQSLRAAKMFALSCQG